MTIGEKLKRAREQSRMSIGDISRKSFIQPKFIQAIDDDNLEIIPSTHRKHFIKEYAKLVGLDLADVLTELNAGHYTVSNNGGVKQLESVSDSGSVATVEGAEPLSNSKNGNSSYPSYSFNAFSSKADSSSFTPSAKANKSLVDYTTTQGAFDSSLIRNILISVIAISLIGTGIYFMFFNEDDSEMAQRSLQTMDKDTAFADSPSDVSPRFDADSLAAVLSTQAKDSLRLDGHAAAQVWYSVVLDGGRNETGVIDSGQTKTWRAEKNFRVSLGNAGNLQLYLNEKPLGVLGPKQSAVKNQLIDSAGIHRVVFSAPVRRTAPVQATVKRKPKPSLMKEITPTEVRPAVTNP